ncbi:ABC transporter substrate-binding protein [Pseudomonas sp. LRF_L74]|uniref:ABC transporter substrate-binding protein n=1 Tax=Pseudomonas sp. LRF_L74 TaxID=3369422 RepID=UPI003F63015C
MRKLLWLAALLLVGSGLHAEEKPEVIRLGAPAIQGDTQGIWGASGVARLKGWFDEEFAKDGIKVEFPGFKGGGPMVGQALANGQIEFAGNGDMISIIGRSSGIKSRLLMPGSRLENAYLLVAPDSPIKSVSDLRGKRVAYFKGNYIQLQVIRILATEGMTEKDIRNVSLLGAAATNALRNGNVDAIFAGSEGLESEAKGLTKVVYSTQGASPRLTAQSGILVREDFVQRYPQITQRVVNVLVKAAHWASEPANKDDVFALWAKGGRSLETLQRDYGDRPLAERVSPLIDPFFVAQYADTQRLVNQLGLLRGGTFDIQQWFDPQYLNNALKAQGLEHYWTPLDANGKRTD